MVERNVVPISVTLDPIDVDLLDRLARLGNSKRSVELRALLEQLRPMIRSTVEALERARDARGALSEAAARATIEEFERIRPRVERIQAETLGALATLEGEAAAAAAYAEGYHEVTGRWPEGSEPPASDTGVTPPPKPGEEDLS